MKRNFKDAIQEEQFPGGSKAKQLWQTIYANANQASNVMDLVGVITNFVEAKELDPSDMLIWGEEAKR